MDIITLGDIEDIVVNLDLFVGARHMEDPGLVILTDVIPNDRPGIVETANQHEPPLVIVGVVVLKDRVCRMGIGVKCLSVFFPLDATDLVELDQSIVRSPRPNSGGIVITPGASASNHIVLDNRSVATPNLDPITPDILQQVLSNHHIEIRESPGLIGSIRRPPAYPVAISPGKMARLNQNPIEATTDFFTSVLQKDTVPLPFSLLE